MITPKFTCSQDESSVAISCYMPAIRASEVEIHVDGTHFSLHVHPYFLRLTFSHPLVEDDESNAQYDPASAFLNVKLTKENPGQQFDDLDLLAKLLAPSTVTIRDANGQNGASSSSQMNDHMAGLSLADPPDALLAEDEQKGERIDHHPLIEVISSSEVEGLIEGEAEEAVDEKIRREHEIFLEAEKNDWRLPQTALEDEPQLSSFSTSLQRNYGFLESYSGFFAHGRQSENEVHELGNLAETATDAVRREMRTEHEDEKWDEEYYMADFVNDEEIQDYIAWKSPYASVSGTVEFTEPEQAAMLKLPRKEYLISPSQSRSLHLTLLSILFSYAYDLRTTQGDPTPESAWTIAVLTPCMSALDTSISGPTSQPGDVLRASYRRALAFPLYRNWALCERLREDVAGILAGGRRIVTRALLAIKGILDRSDIYYVYSKIWLDDYCVWIQSGTSDTALVNLSNEIRMLVVEKASLDWQLEELEEATRAVADDSSSDEEPDSDDE